jgi:hypothetical protein
MTDPRVQRLCAEFDVEIVDGKAYPEPGQTRAVVTIRRIIDARGEAHARLVAIANELRGIVHQRHALAGMLYLQLRRLREGLAGEPSRGKVERANESETAKGRSLFRKGARRSAEEKIEIGRRLLEVKGRLPHGHFGPPGFGGSLGSAWAWLSNAWRWRERESGRMPSAPSYKRPSAPQKRPASGFSWGERRPSAQWWSCQIEELHLSNGEC